MTVERFNYDITVSGTFGTKKSGGMLTDTPAVQEHDKSLITYPDSIESSAYGVSQHDINYDYYRRFGKAEERLDTLEGTVETLDWAEPDA